MNKNIELIQNRLISKNVKYVYMLKNLHNKVYFCSYYDGYWDTVSFYENNIVKSIKTPHEIIKIANLFN